MKKTVITKKQLDSALSAWEEARDNCISQQLAWANAMHKHSAAITSFRKQGHNLRHENISSSLLAPIHRSVVHEAWQAMELRCKEYQGLLIEFQQA
jgi:hypothetical protein